MPDIVTNLIQSQEEWERLCSSFEDLSYRQLWSYNAATADRQGAVSEHVAIHHDGTLIGIAAIRIKAVPIVGGGVAFVSGGPMTHQRDQRDSEAFGACLDALTQEYVRKRKLVLRVQAPIADQATIDQQTIVLRNHGFQPAASAREYRTILIDIDSPEDEIVKRFNAKWRSDLKKSLKAEVAIKRGVELSLFDAFQPLFDELMAKKEFQVDLTPQFYKSVQEGLPDSQKLVVHLATIDDEPVAGVICSFHGNAGVYLFGAADDRGRKVAASYRLQYEAIKYAQEMGCRFYDLGGIDPEGNPGVFRFKKRMGGWEATAAGPADRVDGLRGKLALRAEALYRALQERKRRHAPG